MSPPRLSPIPIPRIARTPDSSSSVAKLQARTAGYRVTRLVTAVANSSFCVRAAASVSAANASRKIYCESASQIPANPNCSARCASDANSAIGGFGKAPTCITLIVHLRSAPSAVLLDGYIKNQT
jgi:hypothetical protein